LYFKHQTNKPTAISVERNQWQQKDKNRTTNNSHCWFRTQNFYNYWYCQI